SVPLRFSASEVSLDDLLPPPGAQLLELWTELDVDLATFGQRAAKLIVDLLRKSGAWPNSPVARVTYQDGYVSSPLVARLLIDTIYHLASKSGSSEAQVLIETRPPRNIDQRSNPWQIWHDWRETEDQRAVVERLGKQRELCVTLQHKDVPHGRYMRIEYVDGSRATIVLDQGFGAWVPLRHVRVRYDFDADSEIQVQRLVSVNAELQRKGSGATYIVALAG